MIRNIRTIGTLVLIGSLGFVGYKSYLYFFDPSVPCIQLSGLEQGGYYCGDVQCCIALSKPGELTVKLDGQPLVNKFKIGTAHQEQAFPIPTRSIPNGNHTVRIECCDATYNKNKMAQDISFMVDNVPLQAAFVKADSDYKVFQGRTLHVQFQVNKDVKEAYVQVLSTKYRCFPESKNSLIYECFVPIPCEETPNEYLFSIVVTDNVGNSLMLDNKFQIVAYPFKKQNLALDPQKVQEERQLGMSERKREECFEQLAQNSVAEKLWRGNFCTPIDIQTVTCDFGTVRTTQEKGRYIHKALDVINAPKSVVWSTQDGVVALKERFEDAGNTVAIDHGCGVISYFYHLDEFANIEVGQKVAKGNPVGTIGKTGYAKGYHLHWEMRVNNIAIDPMQWTKQTF